MYFDLSIFQERYRVNILYMSLDIWTCLVITSLHHVRSRDKGAHILSLYQQAVFVSFLTVLGAYSYFSFIVKKLRQMIITKTEFYLLDFTIHAHIFLTCEIIHKQSLSIVILVIPLIWSPAQRYIVAN